MQDPVLPDWIGSVLFLLATGLSGTLIAEKVGRRGELGYLLLCLLILIYAAAISVAYGFLPD